ncbi:MAG TPA: hypothetical protein VMU29_14985 [Smithella sp.]|nr:hypothetical protein [Smithella sp.]
MSLTIEEPVKLPEALVAQLGSMTVRYQGWEEWDSEEDESSKMLCDAVWIKRYYSCPMLLPLQGIVFDESLIEDCRSLLRELVENDSEYEWRSQYLTKIPRLVERAAIRLFKRLLKEKRVPDGLRPKRGRRRS